MSAPHKEGPKDRYDAGVQNSDYQFDEAQVQALIMLQTLYEELIAATARDGGNRPGFFARLMGKEAPQVSVKGIYFWGGVGRGKTFLMDLFYESLPFKEKKRLHFHRFMREVHHQLRDLQGESNPLKLV
ncbi:MAG: cell division protein ZapE, partial [Pseudomonadales bacterium]|nr:cell division protein ZapE [Pseudomonadales bacterium]